MLQYDLSAQLRNKFGKGASRSLRRGGFTPAVLYGAKTEPIALQFDTKTLTHTLLTMKRRNAVFNLDIEDGGGSAKRHVMLKEIQTKPVDDSLVHVDFHEIILEQPMIIDVPVKYTGKAKGVELGGDLHIALEKVALRGLVLDIPDFIEIEISGLSIGDHLTCGDLTIPQGIEILHDKNSTCVAVLEASKSRPTEEEESEGEEEAAA